MKVKRKSRTKEELLKRLVYHHRMIEYYEERVKKIENLEFRKRKRK